MAKKETNTGKSEQEIQENSEKRTRVLPEYQIITKDAKGNEKVVCEVKGLSEARGAMLALVGLGFDNTQMAARKKVISELSINDLLSRNNDEE